MVVAICEIPLGVEAEGQDLVGVTRRKRLGPDDGVETRRFVLGPDLDGPVLVYLQLHRLYQKWRQDGLGSSGPSQRSDQKRRPVSGLLVVSLDRRSPSEAAEAIPDLHACRLLLTLGLVGRARRRG